MIPFAEVSQVLQVLKNRAERFPNSLWVFADNIEKFGSLSGLGDSSPEHAWFDEFLDMLCENSNSINTLSLKEAHSGFPSFGLIYLPSSSYPEMMRWSLPAKLRADHERSGNPRNFLVKYPEVNLLHKRMLLASMAVRECPGTSKQQLDLLWQSQTSCAYWHGWFGGAYLPMLRLSARAAAVKAETLAFRKARLNQTFFENVDLDLCGSEETIVSTPFQWLLFKSRGGGLLAWEDRDTGFDRIGCMRGHPEECGEKLSRLE